MEFHGWSPKTTMNWKQRRKWEDKILYYQEIGIRREGQRLALQKNGSTMTRVYPHIKWSLSACVPPSSRPWFLLGFRITMQFWRSCLNYTSNDTIMVKVKEHMFKSLLWPCSQCVLVVGISFSIKNYPPLVLKLKWPKARYKIIQHYNEYCVAMLTDHSQSF